MAILTPSNSKVAKARRYLSNARDILSEKAGKDGAYYTDRKYVRMAGNTAWNGVLVALDEVIPAPKKGRKSVEHYQRGIQDGKLMRMFDTAYNVLHLSMGYDGTLDYTVVQRGLTLAEEIVQDVETRTALGLPFPRDILRTFVIETSHPMEAIAPLTPYRKALSHLEKAEETLEKAGLEDNLYQQVKYVKAASKIAYTSVLLVLDEYLSRKEGAAFVKPTNIEAYQARLAEYDKELLVLLLSAHDYLYIVGYYHGTRSVKTIQSGLTMAKAIMEYIAD